MSKEWAQAMKKQARQPETDPTVSETSSTSQRPNTASPQPGRAGKVQIAGFFTTDTRTQLKTIALSEDKTIQGLLGEALNDLFQKYGHGRIANEENKA